MAAAPLITDTAETDGPRAGSVAVPVMPVTNLTPRPEQSQAFIETETAVYRRLGGYAPLPGVSGRTA